MLHYSSRMILLRGMFTVCMLTGLLSAPASASTLPAPGSAKIRLCVSVPLGAPTLTLLARGIEQSVVLAQQGWKRRFVQAGIQLEPPLVLDDATSEGPNETREGRNAQRCLARSDTLAYIGPLNSGVAMTSEPILNRGGMATISPSNTNAVLTDPAHRDVQEPYTYAHRLQHVTYYRMVARDTAQGEGAALFLRKRLRSMTYYVVDDGNGYGRFLASGINRYAATVHLQRVGTAHLDYFTPTRTAQTAAAVADQVLVVGPDAVYCGCDGESAAALASALHHRAFTGSFLGGDSIHFDTWLRMVGASSKTYASDIGIDLSRLPEWFRRAYSARFHTELPPYGAYAYDAASVALEAMYGAVTHHELHGSMFGRRAAVVARVARTCYRGATGITAFDANGDTRNRVVSIYTARSSSWRFDTSVRVGAAPACR